VWCLGVCASAYTPFFSWFWAQLLEMLCSGCVPYEPKKKRVLISCGGIKSGFAAVGDSMFGLCTVCTYKRERGVNQDVLLGNCIS
jgi:hypothetical protein